MSTAALGFILGCVFLARLHRFFVVVPAPIAFDEGYTAALAQRMTEGRWLPYVDGCSHRGPLLYWASALFQAKAGPGSWQGMRWLSLVLCFATAAGTFAAAASVRRPFAGAIAVLIYAYVLSVYHTASSFGILGETISSPLVVLAIACAGFGLARAKRVGWLAFWLALAGVFSALAGLAKQTSLPVIGPIALWTALQLWRDPAFERRTKLRLALALCGGFALPVALTLARYLAAGELATFWYWYYRYNAEVYMAPFRGFKAKTALDMLPAREHWPLLILVVAMVASFTAWLAGAGQRTHDALSRARRGFDLTLFLVTLLVFAGSVAPLRYFYHYFVPLFPPTPVSAMITACPPASAASLRGSSTNVSLPSRSAAATASTTCWAPRHWSMTTNLEHLEAPELLRPSLGSRIGLRTIHALPSRVTAESFAQVFREGG